VLDPEAAGSPPTGSVSFFAVDGILGGFCDLNTVSADESDCQTYYNLVPEDSLGTHAFNASYEGDSDHDPSQGSTAITVIQPEVAAPPFASPGPEASAPSQAAPTTRLEIRPRKHSRKQLAKFTFRADQAGSTFECQLERRPFTTCLSPFTKIVTPGTHTFRVRAVSAAGMPDPTPAVFRWKVMGP
jgi:hypothetical protein